jgi:hypothetical protein
MYFYDFPFRNVDELVEMVNVHPVYYIIATVTMLVLITTLLLEYEFVFLETKIAILSLTSII